MRDYCISIVYNKVSVVLLVLYYVVVGQCFICISVYVLIIDPLFQSLI
jgi:hypothetical protein